MTKTIEPIMTPESLRAWREKMMKLTQSGAAEALDVAYGTYRKWEDGTNPINRRLRLACWALTKGMNDWPGPKV